MRAVLWLNELINKRAPLLKPLLRAVLPGGVRTKFSELKFARTIEGQNYRETFTNIHAKNWWGSVESLSGYGSQLSRTVTIRRELPAWLNENQISSVFDAPCGDFNWMQDIVRRCDIRYLGGDIVSAVVELNNSKFGDGTRLSFREFDVLTDDLPEADVWICRDLLFHLPNEAISTLLDRFKKSNIRYLATTHFKNTTQHPDIRFGSYRPVNLCKPPFNWPQPMFLIFDGDDGAEEDRYLAIWTKHD